MITLTNDLLRRYIQSLGWPTPAPGRLHLLGIRGATPRGPQQVSIIPNLPNAYNDVLGVFGTELALCRGTVDPGRSWTLKPSNPAGCAHLVDGVYAYHLGRHKGKPALNSAGEIRIWRDADRDGAQDAGEAVRLVGGASIGLNLHCMGDGPEVDEWSAGCQGVVRSQWGEFYGRCEASGQATFQYHLVDGAKLAAWVDGG